MMAALRQGVYAGATVRRLGGLLAWACLSCSAAAPALARITLRGADPRDELTVDGAPAGSMADYEHKRFLLPAGHHVFRLRSPEGVVRVRMADVGPGDDIALVFPSGLGGWKP